MLDRDARTVSFTKNGEALGVAFDIPEHLKGQALFPAVCLKNAECRVNFGGGGGDSSFAFPPPPGFSGVAAAAPGQFRAGSSSDGDGCGGTGGGGGGGGGGRAGKGGGKVGGAARTPMALVLEPARDLAAGGGMGRLFHPLVYWSTLSCVF